MARTAVSTLVTLTIALMLATIQQSYAANTGPRAHQFKLANGMQVVVIPDRRAPVVTHMVWYRVGGADEPRGTSGIAHFLEHLMFKSTEKIAMGEFSKIVSRLGGMDNAFTSHDATAYFQRISKDRLPQVMTMEADRMMNLRLAEPEVLTERDVILEERRSRIENNPSAMLEEEISAALYKNHPYGIPVIGWMHEIAKLSREDALSFYKRYYAPNNAILVVSGDVEPDEVRRLAETTYGRNKPNPDLVPRQRVAEPPHRAPVRVELKDVRAGRPSVRRAYLTPSYASAKPGEAEALDLLMKIVGGGATSRLYKRLVVEEHLASSAGGYFDGSGLDSSRIAVSAVPVDGVTLDTVEAAIDRVLEEVREKGVTAAELERAKSTYLAEYIYESDNQSTLARRYGWTLVVGRTVEDVEAWPERLAKVTVDDVKQVASTYFDVRRSVTGRLIPDVPKGDARSDAPRPAPNRS